MPKKLEYVYASIFKVNTFTTTGPLPPDQKLALLTTAVHDAWTNAADAMGTMGAAERVLVFLAPEYYFTKHILEGNAATRTRPAMTLYEKAEKEALYGQLRALSAAYPSVLLVPGTVQWRVARKAPTGRQRAYEGRNTTPILHGGKLLHEYDKKFDDQSFDKMTADVDFVRGTGKQVFKFRGLRCGIEVCGDFTSGSLAAEARRATLDLELYISATNFGWLDDEQMPYVPVRDGGYIVHCDANGSRERNGAWAISRGRGFHGTAASARGVPNVEFYEAVSMARIDDPSSAARLACPLLIRIDRRYRANPIFFAEPPRAEVAARPRSASLALDAPSTVAETPPRPGTLERRASITNFTAVVDAPGMKLEMVDVRPSRGVNAHGAYQVLFRCRVANSPGKHGTTSGRAVTFHSDHARPLAPSVVTDARGEAECRFEVPREFDCTLEARCHGAEVIAFASVIVGGSGNATRLSPLRMMRREDELPLYFLPL